MTDRPLYSYLQRWPGALERAAVLGDPLRPPETDEEPWMPELPDPDAGVDLLDGAVVATSAWLVLTTLTAAALVAVLALLALRRHRPWQ